MQTIKCLLIYPNPESALDEEAGKQLLADYEGYCKVCLRCVTSVLKQRGAIHNVGDVFLEAR
jgi:ubiquitin-protein ligase